MWQSILTNKLTVLLQCLGKVILFETFIFSFVIEKIIMLCFVLSLYGKNRFISLSIFILFVLFCIPGTCVFCNSCKKFFFLYLWSNNQFSCSILRKIFTMQAGDYEWIITYDWPWYEWKNTYTVLKLRVKQVT